MSIVESNSIELVSSATVTGGETEVFLEGMNTIGTYLVVFNNVADSDAGASLRCDPSYNTNSQTNDNWYQAGRQMKNGTNTNQAAINTNGNIVDYSNTGSAYETNGYAYIYQGNDHKAGVRDTYFKITSFAITYNDTDFIIHDQNLHYLDSYFHPNGLRFFPSTGAFESGEFKLYKFRTGS
jgi:hypothetical protein